MADLFGNREQKGGSFDAHPAPSFAVSRGRVIPMGANITIKEE